MRLQRGLPKLRTLSSIKSAMAPKMIKNAESDCFGVHWCPHYALCISAPEKLGRDHHPCNLPTKDRYEKLPGPFWWWLILNIKVGGKKSTVRVWMRRRVKDAFTKALEQHGYKSDGSPLKAKKELKGTALLMLRPGVLEASGEMLLKHSLKAVEAIVKLQENTKAMAQDAKKQTGKNNGNNGNKLVSKAQDWRQGAVKQNYKRPVQEARRRQKAK